MADALCSRAMAHPDRFLLAGVMGWPVLHSRSPLLHNTLFAENGLAGSYVFLEIRPEGLAAALRALHPLRFSGCNLTIPHKQEAMKIVDRVDETARLIGAISCVVVEKDGSLSGSNNDWFGFIHNLKQTFPDWRADAGPVTVIGAGGGSRAVCYGLAREGAKEIRLVNRTLARAQKLATDLGGPIRAYPWEERHALLEGSAMVVNTTSQGMVGNPALDLQLDKLSRSALAADIVYTPLETPYLRAARERGNRTINGLGMLLHQARPAWKAWFGIEPAITPALRAALEESIGH